MVDGAPDTVLDAAVRLLHKTTPTVTQLETAATVLGASPTPAVMDRLRWVAGRDVDVRRRECEAIWLEVSAPHVPRVRRAPRGLLPRLLAAITRSC